LDSRSIWVRVSYATSLSALADFFDALVSLRPPMVAFYAGYSLSKSLGFAVFRGKSRFWMRSQRNLEFDDYRLRIRGLLLGVDMLPNSGGRSLTE